MSAYNFKDFDAQFPDDAPLTLSLSPTLCSMLLDPLLQQRYERHLNSLIDLAEKEIHRTHWDRAFRELAWMYHHRLTTIRDTWDLHRGDLVATWPGTGQESAANF
jgi:1,4-alpha-glucan branching enzyme